jgi:dipeptidyl aminopeptidase/acylaminoacyl peptidase
MKRLAFWSLIFAAASVMADDPAPLSMESYIRPPKEIEEAVTAPWYKNTGVSNISPDRTRYLVAISAGMPKLADLGRPYHNLGGVQIDWQGNRARSLIKQRTLAYEIRPLGSGSIVTINPPKGATLGSPAWSPDSSKVALYAHFDKGTYLYCADAKTGRVKQVSATPVLPTLETQFDWLKDSKRIVAVWIPAKRSLMPSQPSVAVTPVVRVTDSKPAQLRTYAGLMSTPTDFDLLEWHATGQLGVVDVDSGKMQAIGNPSMIESVSPQDNGASFRITLMERPFSYLVPQSSFPDRDVIWDTTGKQLVELSKRPLRLGAPTPPTGTAPAAPDSEKRAISWRPDGQGLSFLQVSTTPRPDDAPPPPEDEQGRGGQGRFGGGAGQGGSALRPGQKDRVMQWLPPYTDKDMKVVYESDSRIGSVQYSEDCKTIFITQTVGAKTRTSAVRLDTPSKSYPLVESDPGDNAFFDSPGALLSKDASAIRMSTDGKFVYLGGTKYFKDPEKDAPRPFVDRVEIETGKKERIWECSESRSESASLLDDNAAQILVSRQSPTSISQTYLVSTADKSEKQITSNRDYASDLTQATRRKYMVTRPDGIKFEVDVTVPSGTKPGAKLPAFFWFYPSEFVDQATYDRTKRTYNKNQFHGVSAQNKLILLRAGYALVEPDCPIIGPDTRKNDEYVPQLRNNLAATIDAICEDGLIDRNRLAIGGHSYGAFSTLNALVNTPFFKAGIAGDGNYNRSLTPFGFQSEQRQLWESREVYLSMSPMLYLEQITGAVLLYHSLDDQNMGTEPSNSPRLFSALQALGKNAALYMYPYEDHGPIAEETVLDQWARFVAWLDKWVKNGK